VTEATVKKCCCSQILLAVVCVTPPLHTQTNPCIGHCAGRADSACVTCDHRNAYRMDLKRAIETAANEKKLETVGALRLDGAAAAPTCSDWPRTGPRPSPFKAELEASTLGTAAKPPKRGNHCVATLLPTYPRLLQWQTAKCVHVISWPDCKRIG
jgi:hypothetical protein